MVKHRKSAEGGAHAKQLTGVIEGHVRVEWGWDNKQEWILSNQIEPIGSTKRGKQILQIGLFQEVHPMLN